MEVNGGMLVSQRGGVGIWRGWWWSLLEAAWSEDNPVNMGLTQGSRCAVSVHEGACEFESA